MECANPECDTRFTPSAGAIFEFDVDPTTEKILAPVWPRRLGTAKQIYWLCARCAREMTLEARDGSVETVDFSRRSAVGKK